MSFRLPHIPRAEDLVDKSFRAGAKEAKKSRGRGKKVAAKVLTGEIRRVEMITGIIEGDLRAVAKHFPSYEDLSDFQKSLLDLRIKKDRYKKSIATLQWCADRVHHLKNKTLRKLKTTLEPDQSKVFLARAASFVKRVDKDLAYMIEVKGILLDFPVVEETPTLVVAGLPNAGKSTFTRTLTGSKVKVAPYPFTTVNILIGYRKVEHMRYQIIDSPGILDRPPAERNTVEKQAILALAHLADSVLFIFDRTQPVDSQENLLAEIKGDLGVPVHAYTNDKGLKGEDCPHPVFNAIDKEDCVRVFNECFGL